MIAAAAAGSVLAELLESEALSGERPAVRFALVRAFSRRHGLTVPELLGMVAEKIDNERGEK